MPLVALCLNLSWEFIFAFIYPHKSPQNIINITWFAFDILIAAQFILYAKDKILSPSFKKNTLIKAFICFLASMALIYFTTTQLPDFGGKFSDFIQSLVISILFGLLIRQRKCLDGQSIYIALFKMIGTILPSIIFFTRHPENTYLNCMYFLILIFDLIYIFQIYALKQNQQSNLN